MERLKELRTERKLLQKDVATYLGVDRTTYVKYENRTSEPSFEILQKLAGYFDVSVDYLLGLTDIKKEPAGAMPIGDMVALRVIANVRAGYGGAAIEEFFDDMDTVPATMLHGYSPDECRLFIVKGDSMFPKILDGDKIIVHVQPSVDSGDTAIVIYNGNEGTVKKVNYVSGEDWVELIPANPEYPTHRIEGEALKDCRVFGKVIGLLRSL